MERNWLKDFQDKYKPLLKDKYDEFEQGLSTPKKKHIRVQLSRNINYLLEKSEFSNFIKLDKYKNTYKIIDDKDKVTESISFQTGGFYIMNPSSVIPAEILSSFMPENPVMLDVSSAPGGKTCALSDFVGRKGLIVANEISSSRLKSLHFNLEKYGCYNVRTISMDGRLLSNIFFNSFDGILLDAPCSNENKIFRNKTVQASWSNELINRMADLQKQLILSAFDCLKEGGVLVYSTCTLSLEENEYVIDYLLKNRNNAELIPVTYVYDKGFSGISYIDEHVARVMPESDTIDGFFIAVVCKKGVLNPYVHVNSKLNKNQKDFFSKYFPEFDYSKIFINEFNKKGYMETFSHIFKNIKFKKRGITLYKNIGRFLEPFSQSIWELGAYIPRDKRYNITYENSINYLKGFDICINNIYNGGILFYDEIPLGYTKQVKNNLKNKLDRYFLYGKNIEW